MTRRVAVVGSGISGLSAAWSLAPDFQVTLFEAGRHFGGHAHTVDVELGTRRYPIHIGPGLLDDAPRLAALAPGRHVLIVSDANVAPHYLARGG